MWLLLRTSLLSLDLFIKYSTIPFPQDPPYLSYCLIRKWWWLYHDGLLNTAFVPVKGGYRNAYKYNSDLFGLSKLSFASKNRVTILRLLHISLKKLDSPFENDGHVMVFPTWWAIFIQLRVCSYINEYLLDACTLLPASWQKYKHSNCLAGWKKISPLKAHYLITDYNRERRDVACCNLNSIGK